VDDKCTSKAKAPLKSISFEFVARLRRDLLLIEFGDSKVDQRQSRQNKTLLSLYEDVIWLDVIVDDPNGMEVLHSLHKLEPKEAECFQSFIIKVIFVSH